VVNAQAAEAAKESKRKLDETERVLSDTRATSEQSNAEKDRQISEHAKQARELDEKNHRVEMELQQAIVKERQLQDSLDRFEKA